MAKLHILTFPDPRLRTVAIPVKKFDKSLLSFSVGCLSVPGVSEEIVRPDSIVLTWQDIKGERFTEEPSGLLTVCIQHEIDHLEGKLMVDYLSPLKRDRIRKKATK